LDRNFRRFENFCVTAANTLEKSRTTNEIVALAVDMNFFRAVNLTFV